LISGYKSFYYISSSTPLFDGLRGVYKYDSAAMRPRYDHSTTYFTTVGLPVCGLLHCGLNK